ncbi:hypothetical protein [Sphingomonas sp.]|jgi:hypothetical protein|uniref:hypothetical protein n=1 Tax=Sphingomonas sp. TaxID=28214 RepID=UPI003561A06C
MSTDPKSADLSRRRLLSLAAAGGGALLVGAVTSAPAAAATKLPQKAVHYQPQPKGKARCDVCLQWQAPKGCKLVAGDIAPSGWCSLYAHKA